MEGLQVTAHMGGFREAGAAMGGGVPGPREAVVSSWAQGFLWSLSRGAGHSTVSFCNCTAVANRKSSETARCARGGSCREGWCLEGREGMRMAEIQ